MNINLPKSNEVSNDLILTHADLGVKTSNEVKHHLHYNENRSSTDCKRCNTSRHLEANWEDRYHRKEERTHQRQTSDKITKILGGVITRADTRDE